MTATAHIVWQDWTHFQIVCFSCHQRLVNSHWSGDGGRSWTWQQKAEMRILARVQQHGAHGCDCCGRPLSGNLPARTMWTTEFLRRYQRGQRQFGRIELVGEHLGAIQLDRVQLGNANLNGVNLNGASLQEAKLSGVALIGADLSQAQLSRADLSGADLVGTNFQGTVLRGAKLIGTDLRGANLHWADLEGAQLCGALVDEASLRGARLQGASLPDELASTENSSWNSCHE